MKNKTVSIWCFTDGLQQFARDTTLVAIDVIRATTTAVTAVLNGWKCHVAPTIQTAFDVAGRLSNVLLAGEQRGEMPAGFHVTNSPALLASLPGLSRPLVLLSSTGTRLMHAISPSDSAYVACFRNYKATAAYLAQHHNAVTIIGAGTRGEFREEDQMCCAWLANDLMQAGFVPEDETTRRLAEQWRDSPQDGFLMSRSVTYLRNSGHLRDLDFILNHFDDTDMVCKVMADEVRSIAIAVEV